MIKIVCDRCGQDVGTDIGYIAWNFRGDTIGDTMLLENEFKDCHFCGDCMSAIKDFVQNAKHVRPAAVQKAAEEATAVYDDMEGLRDPTAELSGKETESTVNQKKENSGGKADKKIDIGKIMALRKAGWSNRNIASDMGLTPEAVANAVYRHKKLYGMNGGKDGE